MGVGIGGVREVEGEEGEHGLGRVSVFMGFGFW